MANLCWWCGGKLTNPFGRPVEGVVITLPGGQHQVRVHKVCEYDAKGYIGESRITAQPAQTN